MKVVEINDFKIALIKKREVFLDEVMDKKGIYIALNYEKIYNQSSIVKECFKNGIGYPDGIGAKILLSYRHLYTKRYTGINLFLDILNHPKQKKIYLLGGERSTIQKATSKIGKAYKNLDIVGTHHGFFNEAELTQKIIPTLISKNAEFVFVGMGSPLQEKIMLKLFSYHKAKYLGVGGAFKVIAGDEKRAPSLVRQLGLEWLYRDIIKPQRFQRDVKIPFFLISILKRKYL